MAAAAHAVNSDPSVLCIKEEYNILSTNSHLKQWGNKNSTGTKAGMRKTDRFMSHDGIVAAYVLHSYFHTSILL